MPNNKNTNRKPRKNTNKKALNIANVVSFEAKGEKLDDDRLCKYRMISLSDDISDSSES